MTHHSPGALHIHSRFSDGTGELDEIARAAARSGLEWIGMTDHNTLAEAYRGFAGIHHGVAVLVGYEWTPEGGDHMLVHGRPDELGDAPLDPTLPPPDAVRLLTERGALTHLAHPDERRGEAMRELPPFPWHDWSLTGFRGLELWNYMSEWAERLTPRNKLLHALLPGTGLGGPTERLLDWWDWLNVPLRDDAGGPLYNGGRRLTVGVSGTDAHAFKVRFLGLTLTIFPYAELFRAFTNYLVLERPLPSDYPAAQGEILDALGAGRLYFANRRLGDALGTELEAGDASDRRAGPGGCVAWSEDCAISVRTPRVADLRLLRDGAEVARARGRELVVERARPGAYRLEARRFGEPWCFTNPVVVRPPVRPVLSS